MCEPSGSLQYELDYSSALVRLKTLDFIMDPQVEMVVSALVDGGGKLEEAAELLSDNYVGHAQLCSLMCDWMTDLGVEQHATNEETGVLETDEANTNEKPLEPKGEVKATRRRQPTRHGRVRVKKESEKDKEAEKKMAPVQTAINDCLEGSLATLLTRHFLPSCADRIFEEGGGGIEFLPNLIAHRRWRTVVYSLIDLHPHCLMLNFAVKLISDAGFQSEISNVNTAAQQLEIFSRVLLTTLRTVLKEHRRGEYTEKYERAFEDLVRVACHSEHSYVYTTALLDILSRQESGMIAAACVHVMESLRLAMKGREQDTTAIRCAMIPLMQEVEDQVKRVAPALLTMTSKGELNPADIAHIYQQYISPVPPPVEAVRDPLFIEMLIDALFHCDGPKMNHEHRDKYIYLLAYVSSVSETVRNGRRVQSRVELDYCRSSIERAASSVESTDEIVSELPDLLREARVPVVASGLLHFVGTLLLSESRLGDAPTWCYVLLDHISSQHPNLQPTAFSLCSMLYDKVSAENEAAEVIMVRQRAVVDRFVHLLSVGSALPVLEKIISMYNEALIDASLVRYFSVEVLDIIAPPYSRELCLLLFPLVSDPDIFDQVLFDRTPSVGAFVEFCQHNFKDSIFKQTPHVASVPVPP